MERHNIWYRYAGTLQHKTFKSRTWANKFISNLLNDCMERKINHTVEDRQGNIIERTEINGGLR